MVLVLEMCGQFNSSSCLPGIVRRVLQFDTRDVGGILELYNKR